MRGNSIKFKVCVVCTLKFGCLQVSYAFSIYSPALKRSLNYSQYEVCLILSKLSCISWWGDRILLARSHTWKSTLILVSRLQQASGPPSYVVHSFTTSTDDWNYINIESVSQHNTKPLSVTTLPTSCNRVRQCQEYLPYVWITNDGLSLHTSLINYSEADKLPELASLGSSKRSSSLTNLANSNSFEAWVKVHTDISLLWLQINNIFNPFILSLIAGLIPGFVFDRLQRYNRFGPRIILLIGTVIHFLGYLGLWAVGTHRIKTPSYGTVVLMGVLAFNGASWNDVVVVATSIRSFPHDRGSAIGNPLALFAYKCLICTVCTLPSPSFCKHRHWKPSSKS